MAGKNKIAQRMKMIERIQAKMKEGDKKMEMMALMLQDLTKESLAKNSVQPHAVEGHYDGNREIEDKKEGESD